MNQIKSATILFSLWAAQGLAALLWLALLPADSGLSGARLLLLAVAVALAGFSAALAWRSRRTDFALRPAQRDGLILLSVIAALLASTTILILRALGQTSGFVYTAYANRLAPLAFWFTLSALELFSWLFWEERAGIAASLRPAKPLFRLTFSFLFFVFCFLAIVIITRLGLTPTHDGSWGSPATPLLEWQILLTLAAGIFFILFSRWKWLEKDRYGFLLVYLFTCLLWLSQPINPGFFATPPRAPNFEIYPFSDALIYAQYAQSALVGNGFLWPDVPARPLYITFLTWLHVFAGQDTTRVIVLQTLVLAAFPAVLYLLGKELGGRPLGIGLAILAAFRDLTVNAAAPFALNYTYSKLFFSEIPAALLISLFTLMVIRWMRSARRTPHTALLIGGLLGLSALIRLQSAVLLMAVIPIGFFVIPDRRKWAVGSALMALGVGLAFTPWLVRNYAATGGIVLDNPISQTMTMARRWSGDNGNDLIPQLPGENMAQYSSRMTSLALESLRQDPGRILGAAANHFFNNEIGNLLVFPLRDQLNSPTELVWPEHPFWQTWDSQPTSGQIPVIFFYLFLLGLGLAAACYKNGLLGLLPLILSVIYNAWTALFLSSGDRFLVPLDWAVYLYLFLGLLTLVSLILTGLRGARENASAWILARYNGCAAIGESGPVSWRGLFLTAALILFLGASIPLTELAFPKILPLNAPIAAARALPGEIVLHGRAIYPRWYAANDGEPGTAKTGYGKSAQARLVFFLVGEANILVIFPIKTAPAFFPNTANVAVTGTQTGNFINAREILVQKDGKSAEYVP